MFTLSESESIKVVNITVRVKVNLFVQTIAFPFELTQCGQTLESLYSRMFENEKKTLFPCVMLKGDRNSVALLQGYESPPEKYF